MKIEKNKHKKWLYIVTVILILGAGSAAVFGYTHRQQPATVTNNEPSLDPNRNKVDLGSATTDQQQAGKDIKKETVDSNNQPTPSPGANIPVIISAASQNGSTLQVRSLIQSVISDGTCSLELSHNGQKVTKSSGVQAMSSSSTCQGFDIPTSELSPGTWTIQLMISAKEGAGAATRSVDIQ